MNARDLQLDLLALLKRQPFPVPGDALVSALVFEQGFGDVEGEEKFITLHVATDYQHYNERVDYHACTFTTSDSFLLNLIAPECSMPLVEFIEALNPSPAVRLGKFRELRAETPAPVE